MALVCVGGPPSQGNDNRSTIAWLPKAAVAPSANWNSTYGVHYKNPAKRFTRNHEYWLKRAAKRVAAQQAAAAADAEYAAQVRAASRASQSFRDFRNPSSLPRNTGGSGVLTARPLDRSLRDTSYRHYDGFEASNTQRFYQREHDVSALRVLEGRAAGAEAYVPIQATQRPAIRSSQVPQPRVRPQTAQPTRSFQQPIYSVYDPSRRYDNFEPSPASAKSNGWTSEQQESYEPNQSFYQHASPSSNGYQTQAASSQNQFYSHPSPDARVRSQTFRPQLSHSKSATAIPANVLLNVAAAPDRYERRAAEYQGNYALEAEY